LATRLSSSYKCAVVYQISSKSDYVSLRHGDLTVFSKSAILNFSDLIIALLKSPWDFLLVFFRKSRFCTHFGDKQTNRQMGSIDAYGDRSRCREWRLKATFHYSSHLQTWFDQVCDKFVRVCDTLSTSFPLFCRNLVANLLHQSRHFEIDAAGLQ